MGEGWGCQSERQSKEISVEACASRGTGCNRCREGRGSRVTGVVSRRGEELDPDVIVGAQYTDGHDVSSDPSHRKGRHALRYQKEREFPPPLFLDPSLPGRVGTGGYCDIRRISRRYGRSETFVWTSHGPCSCKSTPFLPPPSLLDLSLLTLESATSP